MNSVEELYDGVLRRDRAYLAKAISLVESSLDSDRSIATGLLAKCFRRQSDSLRVGVSGVPGVGKSTFIEKIGLQAIDHGQSVAVLAVDPSSSISGGSILGDKTRMSQLSRSQHSFIRPSPASGFLGGIGRKTREAMVILEAAGYDLVFIETVGVGQSETSVRGIVDVFLLLSLPNAGDELQGIKRGITEIADIFVINKVDDEESKEARATSNSFKAALSLLSMRPHGIKAEVLACSALKNVGVDHVFNLICDYAEKMRSSGYLQEQREAQYLVWFEEQIQERLIETFHLTKAVQYSSKIQKELIASGKTDPFGSAELVVSDFLKKTSGA